MAVIYKIRNVVNGKFYVGSSVDARVRFQCHRRQLRKGTHHCRPLQYAWAKHGEDCFKFEIIEKVESPAGLHTIENRWLEEHHGKPYCYNISKCADAPMRGMKFSDEHKAKISAGLQGKQNARGHKRPPEECEAIRLRALGKKRFLGKSHTAAAKAALSKAHKGKRHRLGHTNSPEHRQRISVAMKGKKKSPEHVEKIRQRMFGTAYAKGKVVSAEQRALTAKPVREITTGMEFPSVRAAADHFGLERPNLVRALRRDGLIKRGPHRGLHFQHLEKHALPPATE